MTKRVRRAKQASDASSPVARLQQAATDLGEHFEEGLEELGRRKDSDKPTIGRAPRQKRTPKTDAERN